MGNISLNIPQVGLSDSTEDPKIATNFTTIQTAINGNLDATNLAASAAQAAGVNQAGQTVKGATNIATSESTSSTSYTTLATPDRVANVVLPSNGLIAVWYQATWQQSAASAANAAIFVGSNQLSFGQAGVAAQNLQFASIGTQTAVDVLLSSGPGGVFSLGGQTYTGAYAGDATTGQIVGGGVVGGGTAAGDPQYGPCYIFAAAGSYTVSVQFKCSSGTVTAKNRRLWVQALSFA